MKVRETLVDEGKRTSVTSPSGVYFYPRNGLWAILGFIGVLLGGFGVLWLYFRYS